MNLPLRVALVITIILLAGAGATPASAGEYPVYACEPAHGDVNNSWIPYSSHPGMSAYASCKAPKLSLGIWDQGLVTRNRTYPKSTTATVPWGSYASMTFHAPRGTALSRMTFVGSFCGKDGHLAGVKAGNFDFPFSLITGCSLPTFRFWPLLGKTSATLYTKCFFATRCKVSGSKAHGWGTMRSVTMWVADNTPPAVRVTGGSAVAPGWKRGWVDLRFSAWDNVGVRSARIDHAGTMFNSRESTCNYTQVIPCPNVAPAFRINTRAVSDGVQPFLVRAQDSAGNWRAQPLRLAVDNTAPGPPIDLSVVGGSGWRQRNSFAVGWRSPSQTGTAPIAGVATAVCPASTDAEDWKPCTFTRAAQSLATVPDLRVPGAGEWVARVWLRDAAGNEDRRSAQSIPLRLDDAPPVLGFGPIDVADPTRVDVKASDATSALDSAEVETRRRGDAAWISLPVSRTSSGFAGRLDDEALADGVYDLRARATDSAGNERSTYREVSGTTAFRIVPLRVDTELVAGQVKLIRARRTHGRPRTRRVIVVRPMIPFGATIPIRGRLTTPGGNAVAGGTIEVWEQLWTPGAASRRIAVIGTDLAGRFTFRALQGPSRTLRFRYAGTPIVRARTTEVDVRVKAATTLGVNRRRVVNGDDIVLRGRVRGGPLPSVGKLVQLQAYSRGRWLTFATPRADAATGRWSYRYRFTATRGTVRYRFRVRVPQEAGFPYAAGVSKSVNVRVRGL